MRPALRLVTVALLLAGAALAAVAVTAPAATVACPPTLQDGFGPFGRGVPPARAKIGSGHVLSPGTSPRPAQGEAACVSCSPSKRSEPPAGNPADGTDTVCHDRDVADDRAEALRALVADLERRDEAVAGQIDVVAALAERVGALRGRAVEIREALDAVPAEIAAVERAQDAATVALDDARAELAEAERKREHVEGSRRSTAEEKAAARRTAQDAREALADAEYRSERLRDQRTGLVETRQALKAEAEGLAVSARDIAAALRNAPRVADAGKGEPGNTLAEIEDWGGRARAALFVARGTLDNERERVVAEAHALAEAVLGEQPSGTSVALVRRRLEQALE